VKLHSELQQFHIFNLMPSYRFKKLLLAKFCCVAATCNYIHILDDFNDDYDDFAALQQRAITFFPVKEQQCLISFRRNRRREVVSPPSLLVEIINSEIVIRRVNLVIKGIL